MDVALCLFKIKRFRAVARVTFVKAKVTKTVRDGRCAGDGGAVTGSLRSSPEVARHPNSLRYASLRHGCLFGHFGLRCSACLTPHKVKGKEPRPRPRPRQRSHGYFPGSYTPHFLLLRHPSIIIPAKAGIHGRCSLPSKIKRFRAVARVTFVKAKVTKTVRDGRCAGDGEAVTGSLRSSPKVARHPNSLRYASLRHGCLFGHFGLRCSACLTPHKIKCKVKSEGKVKSHGKARDCCHCFGFCFLAFDVPRLKACRASQPERGKRCPCLSARSARVWAPHPFRREAQGTDAASSHRQASGEMVLVTFA